MGLPTTDLYFRNACADWLHHPWRRGPVRRIGSNTFTIADTLLLIRRDTPARMHDALNWRGRAVYLVDDDIAAGSTCRHLPADYRGRLARFHADWQVPLIERADLVVATSPALRSVLDPIANGTRLLHPFWPHQPAGLDHFSQGETRMVHLGSGSHRGGLMQITPALLTTLDAEPNVRLTCFGRPGEHPALEQHPRVSMLRPMRWWRYRRWIARQRFHIALYPLTDSPFDAARSANKLAEHAIVGAAGICSGAWGPMGKLDDAGICVGDAEGAWERAIRDLVRDRARAADIVGSAASTLRLLFDPVHQREFWIEVLAA